MIVFLMSGLWHGANWNFVIWGCLHAFYILFSLFIKMNQKSFLFERIHKVVNATLISFEGFFVFEHFNWNISYAKNVYELQLKKKL